MIRRLSVDRTRAGKRAGVWRRELALQKPGDAVEGEKAMGVRVEVDLQYVR